MITTKNRMGREVPHSIFLFANELQEKNLKALLLNAFKFFS
jgi:hypothetical protein